MNNDLSVANECAEKLIAGIEAVRASARDAGHQGAGAIGAEAEGVARHVLALTVEVGELRDLVRDLRVAPIAAGAAEAREKLAAVSSLVASISDVLAGGPPVDSGRIGGSVTLVFNVMGGDPMDHDAIAGAVARAIGGKSDTLPPGPSTDEEPFPGAYAPPPDKQTELPLPEAAERKRTEESATPIEGWTPTDKQLEALPFDRAWALDALPAFRERNKGQTAKRWATSFRAYLGGLADHAAHARTPAAPDAP